MSDDPAIVPLFPLVNFYLFPGTAVPLHVFEPRYREMLEDLMDRRGRLVMGTVLEQHAGLIAGAPPVCEVGGLGEIASHKRFPDGRYLIVLVGLARVTIEEVASPNSYRLARVRLLDDLEVTLEPGEPLEANLREAILARGAGRIQLPEDLPVGVLADLLLHQLSLAQSGMVAVYADRDPVLRARTALRHHRDEGAG